jgi:hypothetical protein
MFEPQDYPDDIPYPGAPPTPPYDSAGWTLAFQMGVKFDRILDAFDGPFEAITTTANPPAGRVVTAAGAAGYVVSHQQNDAFIAVNRLLKTGADVYSLRDSFYVDADDGTMPVLQKAASDFGLTFSAVSTPAGDVCVPFASACGIATADLSRAAGFDGFSSATSFRSRSCTRRRSTRAT